MAIDIIDFFQTAPGDSDLLYTVSDILHHGEKIITSDTTTVL